MNMWCHLPTGYIRRRILLFVAITSMIVALITTLILASVAHAAPSTNRTISFQGRLQSAAGAVVPDGRYNMQFKIYQNGNGTAVGNPGGTLRWTENHINNNANAGIVVKNGYFSVNLGSVTPFGSSVDWDQENLWLSMNVAGSANTCANFGTGPCPADGEMLPMKQITASPYALNAGALQGKTADNFIQLGQGVQNDASLNTSSIHVNKTGSGNLVQLQNAGTDVFAVSADGDITLGNNADKTLSVAQSAADTAGRELTVKSGDGGSGTGAAGGNLMLQGGDAGGANADGGSIAINGGNKTGTGVDGTIAIGSSNASAIQVGNTSLASGTQTIGIGNNNTAGGTTNVVVGNGGSAAAGSTTIQAKNSVIVATNGTTRATFSDTSNTVYFGNGVSAAAPNDFTLQGTNSSATAIAGGSLSVQGGNATTGNANGGNVTISGGAGSGTGANGLVVLNTPTFSTVANDANCYTGGAAVAASCTITTSSVNNSAAIIVGFSTASRVATLPDPTIRTAGRVTYISAANGSLPFILRANAGAGDGVEQNIQMLQNVTTTLFWNGNDWTVAGGSGASTLQNAYDNSQQANGSATILSYNDGLTVRNGNNQNINSTLLDVQSSSASKLFSVNTGTNEYASNGGAEIPGPSSTTFPDRTWNIAGVSTVDRYTTKGDYIETGNASVRISSSGAYSGGYNVLSGPLAPSTTYTVSMSVKLETGSLTSFGVLYTSDGSNVTATCQDNITVSTSEWTKVNCTFETPASGINADNTVAFGQLGPGAYTYYIDNLSVTEGGTINGGGTAGPNVQIGSGTGGNSTTLFTLDKSASAPVGANSDALLGSMYYDTTIGKVQCYESEGWGACGASPDTFVTLSPEFPNAVQNGTATGTMTTDFCSNTLNINNGTSGQANVCATNDTYNFYRWQASSSTTQTKSIYVTYKLPASFKQFASGTTSLLGRTDNANAAVTYQIYKNTATGLVACGSAVSVSSGVQSTWQKATASGSADPATCGFTAGNDLVIRINMAGRTATNAYVSNLGFTFSNQ